MQATFPVSFKFISGSELGETAMSKETQKKRGGVKQTNNLTLDVHSRMNKNKRKAGSQVHF